MYECEKLVYLDVQKTGSTTIRRFLSKFSATPVVADDKHAPVTEKQPGKLYIISCRNPIDQYLSLYSHGNSNKGGMRRRLNKGGMSHFYDGSSKGFQQWLNLLLDPEEGQKQLTGVDNHSILNFVGLQTLRFLTLAFASPTTVFDTLHSADDLRRRFNEEALYDVILKTETLSGDLDKLLHAHPELFDNIAAAESFLAADRRKNQSEDLGIDLEQLSPELVRRVQEREWLFFETLGYEPYV